MNDDFNLDERREHKDIDDLDQDLYDPNINHLQRTRRKIHGRDIELPKDFEGDNYTEITKKRSRFDVPTSMFKKIFLIAAGFFGLVVFVAAISLFESQKTVSDELIAFEILAQPFVDGGEDLDIQVRVQNFNEQLLELPDLVITYPKDSSPNAERVFLRRSLQDIGPGQRVTEDFDFALFGQEGDIRDIEATLEYRINNSNSIFIKNTDHQVIIRSTPTQISLDAPSQIIRNQEITLNVNVSANSTRQINDTLLQIQYPSGFEFISSSIEPSFRNNTWAIDNITSTEQNFEIVGRLSALEGQGQSFTLQYGKQDKFNSNQIETVFNSLVHTVEIQQSFIESRFIVNQQGNPITSVRGGTPLNIEIEYENTLDVALQNVVMRARFDGDFYIPDEIQTQFGFYDSATQSIIFDATNYEPFEVLQPGATGRMSFTINTPELVSQAGVLSNPRLNINLDIQGTESNGNQKNALAVARAQISANSDISVIPKIQYYEGLIQNSGPMPPKVNLPTTYTLVFQVTNSSNDVSGAVLKTRLPSYVEWRYSVAPSIERNNVSYDVGTREITWKIGDLPSGLGVGTTLPRELSVQVELTPSLSQVDTAVELTGDMVLSGQDVFTKTQLSYTKRPIQNRLTNPDVLGASGIIQR